MNKLTAYILTIAGLCSLFFSLAGPNGFIQLCRLKHELRSIEQKNNSLQKEIIEVNNSIFGYQNSNYILEQAAREELGLARPDEIVYIFPNNQR